MKLTNAEIRAVFMKTLVAQVFDVIVALHDRNGRYTFELAIDDRLRSRAALSRTHFRSFEQRSVHPEEFVVGNGNSVWDDFCLKCFFKINF